ncbi:hypothetical protein CK501_05660 [Halovibrio salipaludis]|uniref:DNA-binding protein n=1 Tax=Halovibrio salipaludis TaxID=2032626 RepID=A0A2A2F8U3_9GAMM|nr:hypothetical protein [Halovibrio salipaludis]PAU81049.1 hypothetical protein CK501_05660 [Halovibrio salipaludis]
MNGWTTIPAASELTGIPIPMIHQAMLAGDVRARRCTGETVVVLSDVRDMRARMMAERGCSECRD